MVVVTISRHYGAGGHTLGERLSRQFGFHLVDEEAIDQLAHSHRLSPNWLTSIEQEASSSMLDVLSSVLTRGLFYKHAGKTSEELDRRKYLAFLTRIYEDMAHQGGYVIVDRGAQFILQGHPNVIHVLLVADDESRISFLMDHHGLSRAKAVSTIRSRDRQRRRFASCLFEADIDDPSLYSMVLNTTQLSLESVQETVYGLVKRMQEREKTATVESAGATLNAAELASG